MITEETYKVLKSLFEPFDSASLCVVADCLRKRMVGRLFCQHHRRILLAELKKNNYFILKKSARQAKTYQEFIREAMLNKLND